MVGLTCWKPVWKICHFPLFHYLYLRLRWISTYGHSCWTLTWIVKLLANDPGTIKEGNLKLLSSISKGCIVIFGKLAPILRMMEGIEKSGGGGEAERELGREKWESFKIYIFINPTSHQSLLPKPV